MRTETVLKVYEIYRYEELSEAAQQKVREWYLDGQEPFIFSDDCKMQLEDLFPNSELKVKYDLGYGQGDGLNIYGKIYLDELLEKLKDNFTEKELRFFHWYFNHYGSTYDMPANSRYCYCICDRHDYTEEILENLEYDNMRDIPEATLEKFDALVKSFMTSLCKELEEYGYKFFYEIEDDELEEWCNDNDYEFTEDGILYAS